MARVAKATSTAKSATRGRKPGRPLSAGAKPGRKAAGTAKASRSAASRRALSPAAPTPKLSKDELRARVEKLERANATLRTKGREALRNARDAAARIAELEGQVARLEKRVASETEPTAVGRAAGPGRSRRTRREIDPGDAVPPGVAVEEPEPLDEEAETARDNLEEHLRSE